MSESNFDRLTQKWQPVLDHDDLEPIKDPYRRAVTAQLLENEEKALREDSGYGQAGLLGETNVSGMGDSASLGGNAGGTNVAGFDPVLISLVRRNAPNLMAYDICGVQPMNGPTGLIFALRSKYVPDPPAISAAETNEALHGEANTAYSSSTGIEGGGAQAGDAGAFDALEAGGTAGALAHDSNQSSFSVTGGANTHFAENWGTTNQYGGDNPIPEMGFTIEKTAVAARTRALKAEYTTELAQDLKAVHGLDAEAELANILSTEINAEINREVIRTVIRSAGLGRGGNATSTAYVDLEEQQSALGGSRWLVERFKTLAFYLEKEANVIGQNTRRGRGNIIITTADIASALSTSGVLDPTAALNSDVNGSTFAGTISNGIKVYIDPYGTIPDKDWVVVGYKGTSAYDAGLFYCPYVPLQMVRAVGENTFQPKIGFKTRYGMVANPFSVTGTPSNTTGLDGDNVYYRKTRVDFTTPASL